MNELLLRSTPRFAVRRLLAIANSLAICFLAGTLAVPRASAQSFIYVANAGEDTVSKIDVAAKVEVARYAMWFTSGSNNSPTCVIGYPNFPNCTYPIPHPGGDKAHEGPAPSRIARDGAGYVYVLDRFFSTADTWSGSVNGPHFPVLLKLAVSPGSPTSTNNTAWPILDSNNNNEIDPGEATDKAFVWAKSIGTGADVTGLGRALAIDKNGFLWVGIYQTKQFWKVDPNNPNTISGPFKTAPHSPYGGEVDINGHLWSVDEQSSLAEIDTANGNLLGVYPHADLNYSLAIYNDCSTSPPTVKVYLSNRSGHTYIVYDPQAPAGTRFKNSPSGIPQFVSLAIGVDKKGNVVSGAQTGEVIKTTPTGTVLWKSNTAGTTSDLHGLIIDDNDDVWAVDRAGNQVIKYDGANGQKLGTVAVGLQPYTYGNTPPPTCSAGGSPSPTPTPTPTATPTATPGCASVTDKEVRCLPDGSYSYTFNVTNNSGAPMAQVLLTPVTDGAFTLTPQLSNQGSPLASGKSTTITTNIGHVKPGEKVCFFLSLLSDNAPCCIVQVCPTLPQCRESPSPNPSPTLQRR
jgi:hypothetical protein